MSRGYLNNRQKILLYLSKYKQEPEELIAPKDLTQEGIGEAIGIGRNNVPREMKKLMDEGFVISKKLHVNGIKNRRTVYFLTPKGIKEANKIKKELKDIYITVVDHSNRREKILFKDIKKKYNIDFITAALNLDKKGIIDLLSLTIKNRGAFHSIDENIVIKEFFGREKELKELEKWINSNKNILILTGIPGIGKTTLLLKFVKEKLKNKNVLFIKIEDWRGIESLIYKMADFLLKIGSPGLEKYLRSAPLSEDRRIDWKNVLLIVKESLKDEIIIFDNVENADEETKRFLRKIVEFAYEKENLKIIISGTDVNNIVPLSKLNEVKELKLDELNDEDAMNMLIQHGLSKKQAREIISNYGGNPLILQIVKNQNYTMIRKFIFDGIIKNLNPQEKEALKFISVLRKEFHINVLLLNNFEYFTIYSLINKNILLEMEYDRFTIHRTIRNFVYEHLTENERKKYHHMAARYYENNNEYLEAVYHFTKCGKIRRATLLLDENYERYLFERAGEIRNLTIDILNNYTSDDLDWKLYGIIGDTYRISGMWTEALENYKMARFLSIKKDKEFYAKMSVNVAEILGKKGKYDEAIKTLNDIFKNVTKIEDKGIIARAYYILGILSMKKGELEDAKRYMLEAMRMGEKVLDTRSIGYAYNGMGLIEREYGNYKEAIEYFEKARDYFEDCGDLAGLGKVYKNIGLCYYNTYDDSAEKYYKEALKISEKIGDKWTIAHTYLSIANWNMFKENFFEVKNYLEKSKEIFENLNALDDLIYVYSSLGTFYAYLGDGERGRLFFDKAINLAAEIGNERAIIAISKNAAKYMKKYGDVVEEYEKIAKGEKKVVAIIKI